VSIAPRAKKVVVCAVSIAPRANFYELRKSLR
jgi:hypothetical protein